jgi:amino acid transporter
LYAAIGFEAVSAISSKIKNPERNAPLAVLISYGAVITIESLYQTLFYGILGKQFALFTDFTNPFPALMAIIEPTNLFAQTSIAGIFHIGIACSALGGAYGILFTNNWNLYTLAQYKHLIGFAAFQRLNAYQIPWVCMLFQGLLCILYMLIANGYVIKPLQQIAALGSIIAYAISMIALICAKREKPVLGISVIVPALGLASCCLLMVGCVTSLLQDGAHSLMLFLILLAVGIGMFVSTHRSQPSEFSA